MCFRINTRNNRSISFDAVTDEGNGPTYYVIPSNTYRETITRSAKEAARLVAENLK
jgi:hypothetical protein